MKRSELEDQIVNLCGESQLSATEQLTAMSRARKRLEKSFAPAAPVPSKKSYKALTRPSGNVMGKQRREAKSE